MQLSLSCLFTLPVDPNSFGTKTGIVRIFSIDWTSALNFFSVGLGVSIFGFTSLTSDGELFNTGMTAAYQLSSCRTEA